MSDRLEYGDFPLTPTDFEDMSLAYILIELESIKANGVNLTQQQRDNLNAIIKIARDMMGTVQ